jgi:hypothetical protein
VFENRVLRRITGPKREEVAGVWRRLQNKERHKLYASPNIIRVIESRRMRWVGQAARMGDMVNSNNIFVGKPERKRPLGRPRCKWKYNMRMDLRETGWEGVAWIHLDRDTD